MKLNELKPLKEGFFRNEFEVSKKEARKLSSVFRRNWNKYKTTWTMHDGEDHLFTYIPSRNVLMTDMDWMKIKKLIDR